MGSPTQDKIETHLSYLGWGIQYGETGRIAVHQRDHRPNLSFRPHEGGILFFLRFQATSAAQADRAGFLSVVNEINRNTVVATASVDGDGDFRMECWWPDHYDKTAFGLFIERLIQDVEDALSLLARKTPHYVVGDSGPLPPHAF